MKIKPLDNMDKSLNRNILIIVVIAAGFSARPIRKFFSSIFLPDNGIENVIVYLITWLTAVGIWFLVLLFIKKRLKR
jgi:hypothetical protein